jgi:ankyrin repeat protein
MKHLIVAVFLSAVSFMVAAQDIFQAARGGNVEAIKSAIEKGESVNASDARGFTPLILAVYNDQPTAVDFLLKHGASVAQADGSGNTALMGAERSFKNSNLNFKIR